MHNPTGAKAIRYVVVAAIVLFGTLFAGIWYLNSETRYYHPTKTPFPAAFENVATPFTHIWREPSHPFSGASSIDIDGDGKVELFVGGGHGQADALLSYRDGAFIDLGFNNQNLQEKAATHGSTSVDIDGDGETDLLVAREDGLYLHLNNNGSFETRKIPLKLEAKSVPLSVSVADIDADGDGDLYISVFINFENFRSGVFNDPDHAKSNIMLRNDGDLQFTDVTDETGTRGKQNTFHSTFADLDSDGDQDLILSQNTGELEILANDGTGKFSNIPTNTGYGFWMGLGVADFDQDGDLDVFASNVGTSIPAFLTKGDLKEEQRLNLHWALLRNDGKMVFTDIAEAMNLTGYGFAWGAQFEDISLDGKAELLVAQNYIKWPIHKIDPLPSKVLRQPFEGIEEGFYLLEGAGLENPYFGQSPLITDLNADGKPDVVWLNMNGPLRVFLNTSSNNFTTVRLPDNVHNLGAELKVVMEDGDVFKKSVTASTGLMTDSDATVYFGLGRRTNIARVEINPVNGPQKAYFRPEINTVLNIN